ncbi:MAG TPA: DUF2723 domain-containing protein [Gemmatimonas sp.]|nr:DUF2723 domain-containing protein [Gemmatimonas sp.]
MRRTRSRTLSLTPSLMAGVVTTVVLVALYLSTAAPDLTFWDAAEFVTAAQSLGIPHPPGTPLWTLLANVSARLFSEAGPVRSVTILSVIASGLAGGIGASVMARWIGAGAAVAAAVSAGAMMSVWSNATETEVYAVALLLSVCMLAIGERAGRAETSDDARRRARALLVFLAGLAVPLHLSALVALPAAIAFAWRGPRPTVREVALWGMLALLALSAVAVLPLRAMHDPALNAGNPETMRALIAVLRREQFAVSGLWPRTAPLWLQLGNVFQYADWQVAFGLHPHPTPSFVRTPLSILWTVLGVLGLRDLWHRDARVGRAMLLLLASGTLGVAIWLNMRAGPSYGVGVLPPGASHEARERDYFFVLGFWAWGVLAVAGIAAFARTLSARLSNARVRSLVAAAALVLAALPVAANARAMHRGQQPLATLPRTYARLLLDAVPQRGVLFTAGDNDSFPLWYLQQVESYRNDVTVVTVPLLPAPWFRAQLAERDRLLLPAAAEAWPGLDAVLRSIVIQSARANRPYRVSALLAARDRNRIDPSSGWALEGIVYAPSASVPRGTVALDLMVLMDARERVPPSVFEPLLPGIDGAGEQIQGLLRCTRLTSAADSLLVSMCQGA